MRLHLKLVNGDGGTCAQRLKFVLFCFVYVLLFCFVFVVVLFWIFLEVRCVGFSVFFGAGFVGEQG